MAVRNQHARTSKNYIIERINGVQYYIQPETYVSKSAVYRAKNKLISGKIKAPQELIDTNKTIFVLCQGCGEHQFSLI